MKKSLTLIALLAISGCTDPEETRVIYRFEPHCTKETAKQRSEFILQCVKDANPKSDEEPEDWLRICQEMAEETICEVRKFKVTRICGYSSGCYWTDIERELVGGGE